MLTCQRELFSIPETLHYLNAASRSPLLKSAEAAGSAALQALRAPSGTLSEEHRRMSEDLRIALGRLANAPAESIAFIPAASYGVAIAAQHVRLSAGQNVVLPAEEFPSDVYPWMTRCSQDGAELRLVPRPADGSARAFNERLLEAIDGHTAVVNLSSVHWTDGLRFDLAAIGTRARDVGAWFIVDASQTVGAAPFDFAAVQPDLLVCVGYKWLLGTYQLGFAAVGERLREAIPFEQHWGNRDVDTSSGDTSYVPTYRAGARRFDGGEHANSITLPMFREGVRQVEAWGGAAIQAYCTELGKRLQPLAEQDLVQMPAPSDRYAHIVGLRPRDEAAVPRLVQELARRNVRVAQRGSALRVSPYVYNTPQDLDALCETLTDVLA